MKAIENVREKANQVINRYGKVIFTFLIFFTLLGTAQVADGKDAGGGSKVHSEVWCEAGFGSGSCDWMCTTVFLWKECDGGQEQWSRCLDSGRKQSNKGQSVRFIRFIKNRRTGERRTGRDSRS